MVFIKLPILQGLSATLDLAHILGWGMDEYGSFQVVANGTAQEVFMKEADFETRIQAVNPQANGVMIYDFTTPAAAPLHPVPTE